VQSYEIQANGAPADYGLGWSISGAFVKDLQKAFLRPFRWVRSYPHYPALA